MKAVTKDDLSRVKIECARLVRRGSSNQLQDEVVSDSCVRIGKTTLPEEPNHRRRFISLCCFHSFSECVRRQPGVPRPVFERIKAGKEPTNKEAAKVIYFVPIEDVFDLSAPKTEFDPDQLAIAEQALDWLRTIHPREYEIVVRHTMQGEPLTGIGRSLGMTVSGASRHHKYGLARLRAKFKLLDK